MLRRVKKLKSFTCDIDENGKAKAALEYGIKEADSYLDEMKNASIKKYKSVVKEYYKKYTSEVKFDERTPNINCPEAIKQFLMKNKTRLSESISQDELTYLHWMVEFVQLRRDVKK